MQETCSLFSSFVLEFYIGITTIPTQTTTTQIPGTTTTTVCVFPDYATDRYCDDMNNTPECNYDGGACCGPSVNRLFCDACECVDPDIEEYDGCGSGASLGRCSLLISSIYIFSMSRGKWGLFYSNH